MIAFAAGDPLYEMYGNFAGFLEFIFSFVPILSLLVFIYLGYLVFQKENRKKIFLISYLILIVLLLLDFISVKYLFANENPAWLEAIAGILTLLICGLFSALSISVYQNSRNPKKKWFRNLWFLIIFLAAATLSTVLIPMLINL